MGIPFFATLINDFLFPRNKSLRSINLTGKNVIIDGYSFFYFIYEKILKEDKSKSMIHRVADIQYPYDGLWKVLRHDLIQIQGKCRDLLVIFDGVSKPNEHRRIDPERASSVIFEDDSRSFPSLLRDEYLTILHDLGIEVKVAPGEADPVIVQMSLKLNAYILARDSDYFLYQLRTGYVPLQELDLKTLNGSVYQMNDVFQKMNKKGVALWATAITYNFIELDILQNYFWKKISDYEKDFTRWLKKIEGDEDKRQRLICQYSLLRYIQKKGEAEAYREIIVLASPNQSEFDHIMNRYIDVTSITPLLSRNGEPLPEFLTEPYYEGKLDRAVLDILITEKLMCQWSGTDLIHLYLLAPMCSMLLKWYYPDKNDLTKHQTIMFGKERYNIIEFIEDNYEFSYNEFIRFDDRKRRAFVLSCVDFALKIPDDQKIELNEIHRDYRIFISILNLWLQTTKNESKVKEAIASAMIVSFLKHVLLDTYDEINERLPKNEQLPDKPYHQHSQKRLKNYFSLRECSELRQSIENGACTLLTNDTINQELQDCQQFYKELSMINQFSGQPFLMPPPRLCVSQLTYRLAIVFFQSKNIIKDIQQFYKNDDLLCGLVSEFRIFCRI